jgi:hypothetical protein
MNLTRPARSLTAWIAIFAMLVAALAPALSQAVYRASGDLRWLEICTASGIRHIAVDAGPQDPGDDVTRPASACVFCSLFAAALPLPWGAPDVPVVQGEAVGAVFSLHLPRPRPPWADSRPRAPPIPA